MSVPVSVAFRPITWGRYIDELATTVCTHPHDASWSGGCEVVYVGWVGVVRMCVVCRGYYKLRGSVN